MFSPNLKRRHRDWLVAAALLLPGLAAVGQPFVPGQTYFGRSNYIEYIAGNLPVILAAPHGGAWQPPELPDRTYGTFARDTNTEDLARRIRTEIQNRTGLVPHIIICRLLREKIDCNREIVEGAQGHPLTEIAWNEFQDYIIAARTNATGLHGRGFFMDLHGHGHEIQQLELGYLLTSSQLALSDATLNSAFYENLSSIRALSQLSPLTFPALLRGAQSFGALMVTEGYPSVPSPAMPDPDGQPYFNGGYNTRQHGSREGGTIDGVQIECNWTGVRDTIANRTSFAQSLALVLEDYFARHYHMVLQECHPKIWPGGGGNLGTAGNWADGVLPVNTNHLVFAGNGGSVSHNLAALTLISSLSFSPAASGGYTLAGNALSLRGGITNDSGQTQAINNALTLLRSQTFAANSGTLTFGGGIGAGGDLHVLGSATISSVISGNGAVIMTGAGTLVLSAVNTYQGDTAINAGTLQLSSIGTLGSGAGTVRWNGGTLALSATRDTTTGVLPNPVQLNGDFIIQNTTTAGSGTRNFPFGTDDLQTTGGTLTIRNLASANVNTMNLRLQGSGFNFSRPIVFDNSLAASSDNNTVQLDCYNPEGTQTFSGTISGEGRVRRGVLTGVTGGTTIFTGDNTYTGGTTINQGTLLVNNPGGSGTGSGAVVVNANGVLGGMGRIAGAVTGTGTISPGASVGVLTLAGGLDLSAGGTMLWELAALSTSAPGTNFDQLVLTGGELVLGGSSQLELNFTGAASSPGADHPFWLMSHEWKIVSLTPPAANPGSSRFASILNGVHATGSFTNYADAGGSVWLAYRANPASGPVIQSVSLAGAEELVLSFSAETNRTYILQSATNLVNPVWVNRSTNVAPANVLTLTNGSGGDPARFYRVQVVP